jgi:hypothetical protein
MIIDQLDVDTTGYGSLAVEAASIGQRARPGGRLTIGEGAETVTRRPSVWPQTSVGSRRRGSARAVSRPRSGSVPNHPREAGARVRL